MITALAVFLLGMGAMKDICPTNALPPSVHHAPATGQDTVLVEIYLVQSSERIVVEAWRRDSSLMLPAAALHELLGIPPPPSPWMTLDDLRQAYPAVTFAWRPLELRLYIVDELAVLPASRKYRET